MKIYDAIELNYGTDSARLVSKLPDGTDDAISMKVEALEADLFVQMPEVRMLDRLND